MKLVNYIVPNINSKDVLYNRCYFDNPQNFKLHIYLSSIDSAKVLKEMNKEFNHEFPTLLIQACGSFLAGEIEEADLFNCFKHISMNDSINNQLESSLIQNGTNNFDYRRLQQLVSLLIELRMDLSLKQLPSR